MPTRLRRHRCATLYRKHVALLCYLAFQPITCRRPQRVRFAQVLPGCLLSVLAILCGLYVRVEQCTCVSGTGQGGMEGSGGRQWAAYAGGREDPKAVLIEFLCEMLRQNFLVHQRLMPRLFEMVQVPGHKSSLASSPS